MQIPWRSLLRNSAVRLGGAVLLALLAVALLAPWLGTIEPTAMDYDHISSPAGTRAELATAAGGTQAHTYWMGSDSVGRDIWSRVVYGTRVSLLVGFCTALMAVVGGCLLGLTAGFFRAVDAVLMRLLDGLMAIPAVLLAITAINAVQKPTSSDTRVP